MKSVVSATGIALLVVSIFVACTNIPGFAKSPGDVVIGFYSAANEGRYSDAEAMLSEDARNAIKGVLGQMAGGIKGLCDKNTRNGSIAKVDIKRVDVRGEGATVIAKITFKDGSIRDNDETSLIKEKGAWKIT